MANLEKAWKDIFSRILELSGVIYVSISKNDAFNSLKSSLKNYKLVLTIRTEHEKGKLIEQVTEGLAPAAQIEDHSDENASHLIIYCENAATVKQIIQGSFNGATLMSNVRYEQVTPLYLEEKAETLEAEVVTVP